jgi:single-strand DNA-binding protein
MINLVNLSGGLTADPEIREFGESGRVANFNLGFDTGNYKTPHGYIRCTAWGEIAEQVQRTLHKASQVTLTGTLGFDQWEKDGVKRSQVTLTVTEVA